MEYFYIGIVLIFLVALVAVGVTLDKEDLES